MRAPGPEFLGFYRASAADGKPPAAKLRRPPPPHKPLNPHFLTLTAAITLTSLITSPASAQCILYGEAKNPKLEIRFADNWNGSTLKGTLYKNNKKETTEILTCSNGTGTCFFDGERVVGFYNHQPARAVKKSANRYLFTGLGTYFALIGDPDSVAAANHFFRRSKGCDRLLRLIY